MKIALCLKDLNDFNRLSDGEIETIDFQFVDRTICEVPDQGFFQLIPYVTFSFLDTPKGKLNYVIYRRPSKGEGEARLQGNSSIGFGGHIDSVDDLTFTESFVNEEGVTLYKMTLEDIKNTCMKCATREVIEEVGFDAFKELDISNDSITFGLEREQDPDEVGQVHVCISIKVNLDEPRFAAFFSKAQAEETEIEELKSIAIDAGKFLGSFNVEGAVAHMNKQLNDEVQMEKWSTTVINSMLFQLVGFIQQNWDFKVVMDALIENMKAKEEESDQPQDAVVKSDDSQGVDTPVEDTSVQTLNG